MFWLGILVKIDRIRYFFTHRVPNMQLVLQLPMIFPGHQELEMQTIQVSSGTDGFVRLDIVIALDRREYYPGKEFQFQIEAEGNKYPAVLHLMGDRGASFILDVDETLKYFGYEAVGAINNFLFQDYRPIEGMLQAVLQKRAEAMPKDGDTFGPPSFHYGRWLIDVLGSSATLLISFPNASDLFLSRHFSFHQSRADRGK